MLADAHDDPAVALAPGEALFAENWKQLAMQRCLQALKSHTIPQGIELFREGEYADVGLIIARNVSRSDFLELAEELSEVKGPVRDLWLYNGNLIYTEFTPHKVNGRLVMSQFATSVHYFNRSRERAAHLEFDTDCFVTLGEDTFRAAKVLITACARFDNRNGSPNVVGEVGYANPLDELTALAPIYLNQADVNHTELYFIVKIRYPLDVASPEQFQMVFLLYDRQNEPVHEPILIVSCGTLPLSQAAGNRIAELTGIGPEEHPDRHRGYGYGDPPCDAAHAADPMYTVTFGGARMLSLNRGGELPPEIEDVGLHDFSVSLYDLQCEVVEAQQDTALEHTFATGWYQQYLQADLAAATVPTTAPLTTAQERYLVDHLNI
jgi:hypothetical protein